MIHAIKTKSAVSGTALLLLMQCAVQAAYSAEPFAKGETRSLVQDADRFIASQTNPNQPRQNTAEQLERASIQAITLANRLDDLAASRSAWTLSEDYFKKSLELRKIAVQIAKQLCSLSENRDDIRMLRVLSEARIKYHETARKLAGIYQDLQRHELAEKTLHDGGWESVAADERATKILLVSAPPADENLKLPLLSDVIGRVGTGFHRTLQNGRREQKEDFYTSHYGQVIHKGDFYPPPLIIDGMDVQDGRPNRRQNPSW